MTWGMTAVAGATLVGGYMSSQASKSAAKTQADAANNATAASQANLQQQNQLSQPFRTAGETAQNKLMQYLGLSSPSGTTATSGGQTLENFDSQAYLAANPDVAAAIGKPGVESAWAHYMNWGQNEGRAFTPTAAAAATTADYTNSPDFGKYANANFGGVPGFDPSSLMQNFDGVAGFDPASLMQDFQGVPGFDPASLMQNFSGVKGFDPASLMQNFSEKDLKQDPGYAFRLKEGLNAMNASAAARGGLISGNALRAGQQYGQEMGSQEYTNAFNRYQANRAFQAGEYTNEFNRFQANRATQGQEYANAYNRFASNRATQGQEYSNAFNRFGANRAFQAQEYGNAFNRFQTERANTLSPLQTLAGQGQAAAAGQSANIGSFSAQQANNITGAANAQAAGQVGSANAYANAIGQGVGMYQTNQLLNRFAPQNTNTSAYSQPGNFMTTNASSYGDGYGPTGYIGPQ
jgi:hypothetical protein